MKVYEVPIEILPLIKHIFDGFIFNRIDENGKAFIKVYDKDKRLIEKSLKIKLT